MSRARPLRPAIVIMLLLPSPLQADDGGTALVSWSLPPGKMPVVDEADPLPLQEPLNTAAATTAEQPSPYRLSTLRDQAHSVRWEVAGMAAVMTATRIKDVTKGGSDFHFKDEGWFGRSTQTLGMDKLHDA